VIPRGTYPAVVVPVQMPDGKDVSIQFGTSKTKGTRQAYVAFEIIRGPQAGVKIGWFGFFTDNTTDRTLKALRVCGFVGDDLATFPAQRPENEAEIVIDHEEYNGETRAKVQWVNEPGRSGNFAMENALDAKALREFGASLRAKLKSVGPVKSKKAERQAAENGAAAGDGWHGNDDPPPPPAADDDIPF